MTFSKAWQWTNWTFGVRWDSWFSSLWFVVLEIGPLHLCVEFDKEEIVEANLVKWNKRDRPKETVERDSHGDTNSMRRVKLAHPPVECEHEQVTIKGRDGWTEFFEAPPEGGPVVGFDCFDCPAKFVVLPAAQWADVVALVERWRTGNPESVFEDPDPTYYAGHNNGLKAAAHELGRIIGMKEGNDA